MELNNSIFNLNDPLMKAIKAVNTISGKSLTRTDLKRQRKAMELAGRLAAPTEDVEIDPFKVGEIECESIRPDFAHNPGYVILYAHGGGYICGGLSFARILAAKLAIATGFTAFSFAYRLSPENPYPAALEDGMAVWGHLTGEMNIAPDHILLAGDSAGGNLALCMTQKLLQETGAGPGMLLLFSPWTDMTAVSDSYEVNKEKDPTLTRKYVQGAAGAYIAGAGTPDDSRFSPLFGDFTCFPATLIMAGRNEILLDDSIGLKERICAAGGTAQIDIEENGWHVYQQMPVPIAKRAMKRLSRFVSGELYGKR